MVSVLQPATSEAERARLMADNLIARDGAATVEEKEEKKYMQVEGVTLLLCVCCLSAVLLWAVPHDAFQV